MSVKENVWTAIKDFEQVLELLDKDPHSEVGKSFRSRCREMPSLIEDVGFTAAISFCYAKAEHGHYESVIQKFKPGSKISVESPTKKGYALYLFLVLKRLKDLGLLSDTDIQDPLRALEKLDNSKSRVASRFIKSYLLQLKKLSEAYFEPEER